ncbi:YbfB/YjiJ family MFS transporter [Azospirillum sp. RWY-5-1]|uniref:YbfB/YjiJ family MFS transporter n=1 Tax=Azospirillum oleiclasticum TaxID=2735135 RepID=A0ABX2TGR5_9PROT|nr:YbfB/YjiJ family MFS transporter [Azospirillum oleiclasticum]NYZ16001.1 YbfB/YjiJ family MFS transporter [Azospirillum oleiclasticum]NYZ23520.1 YbfB/YjiJ family MFS transporter [Azospirillum oleiclasticum]
MIRVLLGGLLALTIAMGIGRFAFTPILPYMQAEAGLGVGEAGLIASINFLGYLLGAVVTGLVPQGAPRTWAFRVSLVASVSSTAGMGLTTDLVAWSVLRFVSGVASAGMFVLGIAMTLDALARAGRENRAGWLYSGVGIGIAGSGLFVALSGGVLDWSGKWLALGLICAVLAPVSWSAMTDQPRPAAKAADTPAGGGWLSAPLLLLTAAYFLEGAGYIVTGTFLVAILKGMPDTAALGGIAWMVTGLAAAVSPALWAWTGRRLGLWRALMLAHTVQAVGILLPLAGLGVAGGLLSAALYGGTFVGIVGLAFGLGRQLSGGASARIIGALTTAYSVGQVLGPLPAGLAVEATGSYGVALAGAAGAVMLGTLLLALGSALSGRGLRARAAHG